MAKNLVKLVLDVAMGVVFALLFNHRILGGLTFHEIAGLAIGGAVVAHVLLNAKWVKRVARAIFDPKTAPKTRLEAILNVALLVCLIVILACGVLTSKVLFPGIAAHFAGGNLLGVHIGVSYIMLVLLGIHVGLHKAWIVATARNLLKIKSTSKVRKAIANALLVCVLCFGCYSMVQVDFPQKVSRIWVQSSHGGHGGQGVQQQQAENKGGQGVSVQDQQQGGQQQGGQGASVQDQQQGGQQQGGQAAHGGMGANINPAEVAVKYLSIMGAFAAITGYLEMLLSRFKKQRRNTQKKAPLSAK